MSIDDLKDKIHLVAGLGKEGLATARFLLRHGIVPLVCDRKDFTVMDDDTKQLIQEHGLRGYFGSEYLDHLGQVNVVWRSPGVWRNHAKILAAEARGVIITSQTKWFLEQCPAVVVGVTGTKGKGTTSSLIYDILKTAVIEKDFVAPADGTLFNEQSSVFLTGNIGLIDPFDILENVTERDVVIFELSSFQLMDISKSPRIAVVLMVTREHLDHHADEAEYVEAKSRIVLHQTKDDVAIICQDYPNSVAIGDRVVAQKFLFSRKQELGRGCFLSGDSIVLRNIPWLPETHGEGYSLVHVPQLQIRGAHNIENVAAASLAAAAIGAGVGSISKAVLNFKGLEHRLEFVDEKDGVAFYNDSFSTVPETAIAAIEAFTEPKILILGGSEKNSDFSQLGRVIALLDSITAIILIGEAGARIRAAIEAGGGFHGRIMEGARGMSEIMAQVRQVVRPGDIVLLSPAAASFGMFKNYKDRGQQFKSAVLAW